MAIVYLHKRNDTGQIFYVGIGAKEKRASIKFKRNKLWNDTASISGFYYEITHRDICWEEACCIEKYLIFFYVRIDKNNGILTNKTNGGEGTYGAVCSEDTKLKISKKQKIKLSNKENHPMYGKKQTIESKKKNSESQKGDKSPLFGLKGVNHPRYGTKASKEILDSIKKRMAGNTNPNARKIIVSKNGIDVVYLSINDVVCNFNSKRHIISKL